MLLPPTSPKLKHDRSIASGQLHSNFIRLPKEVRVVVEAIATFVE